MKERNGFSETTRQRISEGQRRRWASGTRKPNPPGYGRKGGETRRQLMAEGKMQKRTMTPEQGRNYRLKRDENEVLTTNQAIGRKRVGTEMKTPASAKGPDHHKSCYWVVRNKAMGVTLRGRNLNHLVRENAHHFDPKDLNWNGGHKCRATRGLRRLFEVDRRTGKPRTLSWKGWVAFEVGS